MALEEKPFVELVDAFGEARIVKDFHVAADSL
jgi:hypothetical protein